MENNWKPAIGEDYWLVGGVFQPLHTTNDGCHTDVASIAVGNCFKTMEEAQAVADRFKEILKSHSLEVKEPVDDLCLLPEWCKNAEYLYDRNAGEYACITSTADSEVILVYDGDIEPTPTDAKYIVDYCEEAKCNPLSDDELKDLVGKVLTHPNGEASMVIDFRPGDYRKEADIYFNADYYTADELVNSAWRNSNCKCGNFTT